MKNICKLASNGEYIIMLQEKKSSLIFPLHLLPKELNNNLGEKYQPIISILYNMAYSKVLINDT